MKPFLTFLLLLTCLQLSAQIDYKYMPDSWVKTRIVFKDGTELADDVPLKYAYIKYIFTPEGELFVSTEYSSKGQKSTYLIDDNLLRITMRNGFNAANLRIEKLSADTLVLLQKGTGGFDDPTSLRIYYVPERVLQKAVVLKPDDIFKATDHDTIYNENPKLYPEFTGELAFREFMSVQMSGVHQPIFGHLLARFIVDKQGMADSVQILEGISPEYDRQFINAFMNTCNRWRPAMLNGRPVSVAKIYQIRFLSSDEMRSSGEYSTQAQQAYNERKYQDAVYLINRALVYTPYDTGLLFKRGLCYLLLGNGTAACEDFHKLKELQSDMAEALIAKYCR